jgi:hypothetical protein
MSEYIYYALFTILLLVGAISTVVIGISQKNKEGDPKYDLKTGRKWARLSLFYIISICLGLLALYLYIR